MWPWLIRTKPALAASVLALLWLLESIAPMFVGRDRRTSHYFSNLALGLFNAAVVAVLFGGAALLVTEWARQLPFGLMHWLNAPVWLSWPVVLVLFDAWMYTWHVLNHKTPLLWRFHAVHHADREVDASTALRFHTGEIVLSSAARLVVLPVIGMTMPQLLLYEVLLLPVILFHHSNIRVPPRLDATLRWIIPTPWMHWVHHSRWRLETDSNYGSVLSIWDRMFGTLRLRADPDQLELGLNDDQEEREWRTLRGMLWRPFLRTRTLAIQRKGASLSADETARDDFRVF
jgi:sterol desaturase/sphingolipid hydroxylase (fatty acid hydroxylase superfamily)